MGREELRAALEELTASLVLVDALADPEDDPLVGSSAERLARLELLEELRGL